ncbi:MAG TPA: hypothetical protein DDZ51_18450, partial [Planctomycetaceae bacterium]|nr:hypothetical protein [Planctomycetaceae bacterium]
RRGLGLGGSSNSEAGFVYRLTPRQRKQLVGLLKFAGPATEVRADRVPETVTPTDVDVAFAPTFLAEVIAKGSMVTVHFRDVIPPDLVLLMPIPARAGDAGYWFLFQADPLNESPPDTITLDLKSCQKCDDRLQILSTDPSGQQIQPHVFVEVRWQGHSATFPVRFDDKAQLPLLLVGRKPTEGELIEYFLFGTEPDDGDEGTGLPGDGTKRPKPDAPIDTSRILAYFIRHFVWAIPGIEAEIHRAGYSRASLDAVLRGPTSPLELAELAFASLNRPPTHNAPQKTPTAVGFQLTEILAALIRAKDDIPDPELKACFDPVISRCREVLNTLIAQQGELQVQGFRLYQVKILGDAQ